MKINGLEHLMGMQKILKESLNKLQQNDFQNSGIKPGNIESLIRATQLEGDEKENELGASLNSVHAALDELNEFALNLLNNANHKTVEKRNEDPKPVRKNSK